MKTVTQKAVISALFAAIICVATMTIRIPLPLNSYANLGDGIILLTGWLLPFPYSFLAAGIGSAAADLFSGYAVYIPATFIIKGLMSVISYLTFKAASKKSTGFFSRIISGISAELIMVSGYFLFDGVLYGFIPSAVNIPGNIIQGAVGIIISIILVKLFEKYDIINRFNER